MEVKGVAGGDLVQTIPSDKYEDKEKVRNRKRQTPYIYMYVYIEKENSELKKLKDEDKEKEKHRTRLDAHNLYTGKETVKDVRQVEKLVHNKYLRRDGLTKSGEDPLNLGLPRSQFPQLLPDQTTIDVNKLKTIEVEDNNLCRRELSKCPKNLCVISAQNCQRGGGFRIPVNSF